MKADTTRSTFKQTKHYSGVLMQQGRVQLDADWNEQIDITGHRIETETIHVIGNCGAPMHDAGFHIVANTTGLTAEERNLPENKNLPPVLGANDLLISGGRYYVDGILCENDSIVAYMKQPDLPNPAVVNQAGTYLAYLDVWSGHVTALEDPSIREVALGGPDTTTRSKTIWQVKLLRVPDANLPANCATEFPGWDNEIAAGNGELAARAATSAPSNDPCIVAPGAGYRRLENQHYRVEVHDTGKLGTATFKFSRDNGSIVTKWESQAVNDLTVSNSGRDAVLRFAAGNWVELSDDTNDLLSTPGTLVQLAKVEGNVLTIDPATAIPAAPPPIDITKFSNPKLRRWDMAALLKPNNDENWLDLEDGVQVHFTKNGTYKTGDYWLIPARTATADVEWPIGPNTEPATQLPFGIKHHYCRLAILETNDGKTWTKITDCRHIFPPLTELIDFFYVGGDGQEAMPDLTQPKVLTPLPLPLEAGVTNGEWPVAGAQVEFTVIGGGTGELQRGATRGTKITLPTDSNGIASCMWSLDATTQAQQVKAELLDEGGNPICVPIHYQANLSVAREVAYDPRDCAGLQGQKTVQDALSRFAAMVGLYKISGDGQEGEVGKKLPQPLVVLAANHCGAAAGLEVQFQVISGGGNVSPPNAFTNAVAPIGFASCEWSLGLGNGTQELEATLVSNDPMRPITAPSTVRFTAFSAEEANDPAPVRVVDVRLLKDSSRLPNDSQVSSALLRSGIAIVCDRKIDKDTVLDPSKSDGQVITRGQPTCFVTAEIPYPITPSEIEDVKAFTNKTVLIGYRPIVLRAIVNMQPLDDTVERGAGKPVSQITWQPDDMAVTFLEGILPQLDKLVPHPNALLLRLTLKGNFIWSDEAPNLFNKTTPGGFLDGDSFRTPRKFGLIGLILPSGDRRRGGDFDMWFWLVP
jgi:hypothetical protein